MAVIADDELARLKSEHKRYLIHFTCTKNKYEPSFNQDGTLRECYDPMCPTWAKSVARHYHPTNG